MKASQFRVTPGTRPLYPVRSDVIPDDWHCTWVYRAVRWPAWEPGAGFWELKFVNSACPAHNKLEAL